MIHELSHERNEESALAKARWFQSLSLEERMEYLCAVTNLVLENQPDIADRKHAGQTSDRVRIVQRL